MGLPSVLLVLCAAAPVAVAQAPAAGVSAANAGLERNEAARAGDVVLTWAEFDALLLDRHGQTDTGKRALAHLLRAKVLDRLATESKLVVAPAEIERRWKEMEGDLVRSGQAKSLAEYLRANRVSEPRFREFLRLGIVQEQLSRAALGVPANRMINAEQQEMWLDQILQQRGTQFLVAPWTDGVAARCGDLAVKVPEFLEHLKGQVSDEDMREDCYQALLAKRARARMPDLAGEGYTRAIEAELARRRAEAEADPRMQGAKFEQVLGAQGLSLDALRRDPAITITALSSLWIERTYGEDGLRRVYNEQREWFDTRFGEARELRVLFLRGALYKNELNPRTFDEADKELGRLRTQATDVAAFERLVKLRSEDTGTRDRGGLLGFVSPGEEAVPQELRLAVFSGPRNEAEHCVGPVRMGNPSGVALVWVGARRPSPGWEEMRGRVHNELRRRFIESCLSQDEVVTFLDGN